MNRIYRRLWSTARQCWVVASELASAHGKAGRLSGAVLVSAACILIVPTASAGNEDPDEDAVHEAAVLQWAMRATWGAGIPAATMNPAPVLQGALTTDYAYANSTVSGNHLVMLGSRSAMSGSQSVAYGNLITSRGENNTAIGYNVQITGGGYATGIGASAVANGIGATAVGNRARAYTENSVAVGSGAVTDSGAGISKIAIGGDAYAGTGGWTGAVALGGKSRAEYDGIALGYEARATASGAVALGRGSLASEGNAVSVGNSSTKRRIINVADARLSNSSTDAVTGKQLYATNQSVTTATNTANAAKVTADQALASSRLVTQTSSSSAIRVGADNTGTVVDVANRSGTKRRIQNIANGVLSATSTDAVTGQQLHGTNQTIAGAATTANEAKVAADDALGKVNIIGGIVAVSTSHSNSVVLGSGSVSASNDSISVGNTTTQRKIQYLADGAISAGSTDAITGNQLHAANLKVADVAARIHAGALALGDAAAAEQSASGYSVALGRQAKAYNGGGVALGDDARAGVDASGEKLPGTNGGVSIGKASRSGNGAFAGGMRSSAVGDRSVAIGNDAAATGSHSTAMGYNAKASHNQATALGREAQASGVFSTALGNVARASADSAVALGDRSVAQHVRAVALGSGSQTTASNQVSVGSSTLKRRIVNLADGTIADGSNEAITGHQLHATHQAVSANADQLVAHAQSLTAHDGRIGANRSDIDQLREDVDNFDPDLEGVVKFNVDRTVVDVDGARITGLAEGSISSASSTDAVNGGQLFATNQRVAEMELSSRYVSISFDGDSNVPQSGVMGVAIGDSAEAAIDSDGATAIGTFARARAQGSVALGRGSFVDPSAVSGFALGTGSNVYGQSGVALGSFSQVERAAEKSVALGAESVADEAGVVSVGNETMTRRLVNLARGRTASDATTVAQLGDSLDILGGGASLDAGGNIIAPIYSIQGITHNTVGDALTALDGAVVATDARVGSVEAELRSVFQDVPSVRSDGVSQLMLAGANGMVLTNLADGHLAAGSRDAVTGSQLFAAKQDISRNREALDALKLEQSDSGLAQRDAWYAAGSGEIDFGGARLTGVADARLSADSSDVVNGAQLFSTNEKINGMADQSKYLSVGGGGDQRAAEAGPAGVAIGDSARASVNNEGGVAVGSYASALGMNSVALGRAAAIREDADDAFALGTRSLVEERDGIAIGSESQVKKGATGSIAFGTGSVASQALTVSFGNDGLKRRLVNIARGTGAHDATTVAQLNATLATLGGGAHIDSNGDIVGPRFNVQGGTSSTLGGALASLDTAVVANGTRVDRVEGQLRAVFQEDASLRSDGQAHLQLAGANGMVLGNVGNGLIAAGSREAVNGGQVHALQQRLDGRIDGLEQRIDGQPQPAASALASTGNADMPASAPVDPGAAGEAGKDVNGTPQVASASAGGGGAAKADAPAPTPQVDTAELEKMLARANDYTDNAVSGVERRLDKMDKRFNRMAAMSSAQTAMAMNTAGLATYNRLGAGVGYADGESAMAVGYQRVLNERGSATFSLNGAFTNSGEQSVGLGVGIGW